MGPIRLILSGIVIAALLLALFFLKPMLEVATGYAAKMACSAVYVSGRTLEDVLGAELSDYGYVTTTPRRDRNRGPGGIRTHRFSRRTQTKLGLRPR